jgi:hypothetical protein
VRLQVSYSKRWAKVLHNVPLAFVLATPWRTAQWPRSVPRPTFASIARGAGDYLFSMFAGILVPAALGACRVALSRGHPLPLLIPAATRPSWFHSNTRPLGQPCRTVHGTG